MTPTDFSMPRISVLMPLYNAAPFLEMAVQSIFRQDLAALGGALEIVIVDDGSTDGSTEIARALARQHTEIQLIEQENFGIARARNVALSLARGEIICFLDADDEYVEGALNFLVNELELLRQQHGDLVMVRGLVQLWAFDQTAQNWRSQGYPRQLSVIHSCAQTRATFDRIGDFNEEFKACEDSDWLARAQEGGVRMPLRKFVVTRYRQHGANTTSDLALMQEQKIKMLKKAVIRKHLRRIEADAANPDKSEN